MSLMHERIKQNEHSTTRLQCIMAMQLFMGKDRFVSLSLPIPLSVNVYTSRPKWLQVLCFIVRLARRHFQKKTPHLHKTSWCHGFVGLDRKLYIWPWWKSFSFSFVLYFVDIVRSTPKRNTQKGILLSCFLLLQWDFRWQARDKIKKKLPKVRFRLHQIARVIDDRLVKLSQEEPSHIKVK